MNKKRYFEELLGKLKNTFENRFYLEIQRHSETQEKHYEGYLLEISKKFELPLIASQEVYYLNSEMSEAHDALVCIGLKTIYRRPEKDLNIAINISQNSDELKNLFSDLPEALEKQLQFSLRFSFKPKKSKPILPSLSINENTSVEEELNKLRMV